MSSLKKLTIKTIARRNSLTPTEIRRKKLVSKIEEQFGVLEAALKRQDFKVTRKRWVKDGQGARTLQEVERQIRAWFFEQDGGFYVQCKYGAKAIGLSKDGNAVFVKQLSDVKPVLEAFRAAAVGGELDAYVETSINVRKNRPKKAA